MRIRIHADPDPQHWRTYLGNCVWEAHPTTKTLCEYFLVILGTLILDLQFYVCERREETLQVTCSKHPSAVACSWLKFLYIPEHSLVVDILLEQSIS
jgi:hypothetical protein